MALHVLIVGGGFSGLCLAHGLHQRGIDVDVFDSELSPFVSQGQSYRLTIDSEGSHALEACLPRSLYDLTLATKGRPDDTVTIYSDRKGVIHRAEQSHRAGASDDGDSLMPVDHYTLRQILLGHLDTHVRFAKYFTGYDVRDDRVVAHFDDGTEYAGDLLVGSDGIESSVRHQLLPDVEVADTGVRAIFGRTPLLTRGDEILNPRLIDDDFVAVAAPGHALIAGTMRFREPPQMAAVRWLPSVPLAMRDDYISWAVLFPSAEFEGSPTDTSVLQDEASLQARQFPVAISQVVAEGDPTDAVLVPIRIAASAAEWETTRVTLMGDAVHAMPALGSHDVNSALHDAALLTDHLVPVARGERDLISAVHDYEATMLRDGFRAAERAHAELGQVMGVG